MWHKTNDQTSFAIRFADIDGFIPVVGDKQEVMNYEGYIENWEEFCREAELAVKLDGVYHNHFGKVESEEDLIELYLEAGATREFLRRLNVL